LRSNCKTIEYGEWSERIGWHLATRGPTTYSGIMRGLELELGWRNGARKALGSLVATNRASHIDTIYRLTALGALDLANSLLNSQRFTNLSVCVSPTTRPYNPAEGSSRVLSRSNFDRTGPVSFLAPASIGNVLSIAASGVNTLIGSASSAKVLTSISRPAV
jgi:hypothetical protein